MRFKLFSLLLILVLSACSFQVEVLNTPTPPASETLALPDSPTPTVTFSQNLSATPPPTSTATNTALPIQAGNENITPIHFAPDGTYVDIIDSIPAGKSKTYSVNAMKGQVMSVSFHQNEESEWTYITMRIVGDDDMVLCASDCQFWRGVLPATENFYVTVSPSSDASDFVMRVAIDPPGVVTQSFLYENKYRNATLSYTDMFAPTFFPGAQVTRIEPELELEFIDTQAYDKTNLIEAYFLFGSSTDAQLVSTCTQPASLGGPETVTGTVPVNGIPFTKSEASGVGAGNIYEQVYYRVVHNAVCYEITYFIHYANIGNYPAGEVTEFDQASLLQKFDEILSTLFLK
jgi:hypothetical protein